MPVIAIGRGRKIATRIVAILLPLGKLCPLVRHCGGYLVRPCDPASGVSLWSVDEADEEGAGRENRATDGKQFFLPGSLSAVLFFFFFLLLIFPVACGPNQRAGPMWPSQLGCNLTVGISFRPLQSGLYQSSRHVCILSLPDHSFRAVHMTDSDWIHHSLPLLRLISTTFL